MRLSATNLSKMDRMVWILPKLLGFGGVVPMVPSVRVEWARCVPQIKKRTQLPEMGARSLVKVYFLNPCPFEKKEGRLRK